MTSVDTLVERLCPLGVEHKPLGEIANLVRGNGMPKADLVDEGVGAIHYGQIYTRYKTWTESTISFVTAHTAARLAKADPGDVIVTNTSENIEDVGKAVAWLGADQIVTGGHATIVKHKLEPKYLAYWFQSPSFATQKRALATGTKVIDVSARQLERVRVPVPPVEVQREIVRILDTFTELEAGLELELQNRRSQYVHYRRTMLAFPEGAAWKTISAAFTIVSIPQGIQRSDYGEGTLVPIVDQGQDLIAGYTDNHRAAVPRGEYIVFGDHTRTVKWVDFEFAPGADGTKVLRATSGVLARYGYYAFSNVDIPSRGYNRHWTIARQLSIPIPPIEMQRIVVRSLDAFTELILALQIELAARRKQYEYYRDRLLTFREIQA